MRRTSLLVALVATAGCASSPSPSVGLGSASERTVAVDDQNVYRTTVIANSKEPVPAAPGRVFEMVRRVYEELGVPPAVVDVANARVGNSDFWKQRRFADEAMSQWLNCGDSFSGPVANNYRIYMSLMSAVHPDGKGGSLLETAFSAQAQNMEGSSSDRIACGSTGRLEERIRKAVLLKIGSSPSP